MKKKLNKIAALVLALVMVITGFVAVPQMDVQAANDVPSIITKTDVTNMKPGDKVHVECWLKPNGNVMQVVGGFDFMVTIEGKTLREVSQFVSNKLSPLDSVLSTKTNFILKKYKDHGTVMAEPAKDERIEM